MDAEGAPLGLPQILHEAEDVADRARSADQRQHHCGAVCLQRKLSALLVGQPLQRVPQPR